MEAGPLEGIRGIEVGGIGPAPFGAMVLADLGAEILRIDRNSSVPAEMPEGPAGDLLARGRQSAAIDLKHPEGVACLLRLVDRADFLLEGFRPGVMERLGLGPDPCLKRNPRLVYGRMTGFGQSGPLAQAAGHDINYIALAGALHSIGRAGGPPVPPLNLLGDFGGGGMFLAFGVLAALLERTRSGRGQVVDAAMVDGSAVLMTLMHSFRNAGRWSDERGTNINDTGAPFYETYECADGEYVAIGSLEPAFYAELLEKLGLKREDLPRRSDRSQWPEMKARFGAIFKTRTRAEWCEIMEGSDVCFAPVLNMGEAIEHPHNVERETFVDAYGVRQPAPAPRFSRTPAAIDRPPPHPGQHTDEALAAWGIDVDEIRRLRATKAIG
ncbi:MAG: CaiB/BaiF CoA transferase family protein [Planctomycetota bacterium]